MFDSARTAVLVLVLVLVVAALHGYIKPAELFRVRKESGHTPRKLLCCVLAMHYYGNGALKTVGWRTLTIGGIE